MAGAGILIITTLKEYFFLVSSALGLIHDGSKGSKLEEECFVSLLQASFTLTKTCSVTHINTVVMTNAGSSAALTPLQQPARFPATNTHHCSQPRAGRMTLKEMGFCWCAVSFWCFAGSQFAVALLLRGLSALPRARPCVWVLPALGPIPALVAHSLPVRGSVRPGVHGGEFGQHHRPHLQLRLGLRRRGFYGRGWHRRRGQVCRVGREEKLWWHHALVEWRNNIWLELKKQMFLFTFSPPSALLSPPQKILCYCSTCWWVFFQKLEL